MEADLTGAFASIVSGGVTGLVGSVITRWADYKTEQMRLANALEVGKLDADTRKSVAQTQATSQMAVAQTQAEGEEAKAAYAALSASFDGDKAAYINSVPESGFMRYVMGLVDAVRGLIRPAITTMLLVVTFWLTYILQDMVAKLGSTLLPVSTLLDLWGTVINMVLYLTASAVLWWFGGRIKAPK